MTLAVSLNEKEYSREAFFLIDYLGTIGGIRDLLIQLLEVFVAPISEFFFVLNAISTLFIVKQTTETKVFPAVE